MSCVDWNVLKTIADFPLCLYALLQSSAPSSLGTGYFVSLSQLPHVCLALALIYFYDVRSWGCEKKSEKSPLSPKEQTDTHPFIRIILFLSNWALGQSEMYVWFLGYFLLPWQRKGNLTGLRHLSCIIVFFSDKCHVKDVIQFMYWGLIHF